jgi:ribosomal protein S18 acetylase RimI-like enzyme
MQPPLTACFETLSPADIDAVCQCARTIWQATYPALISQAQIDFMLADRYAAARIREQLADPAQAWRVARIGDTIVGFAHASLEAAHCKLDKLYVDPAQQRRGIGRALLDDVAQCAREHGATRLWLQVNRGNAQAIAAYQRYGFCIERAQVFAIGGGFVMDDYVMGMSV